VVPDPRRTSSGRGEGGAAQRKDASPKMTAVFNLVSKGLGKGLEMAVDLYVSQVGDSELRRGGRRPY